MKYADSQYERFVRERLQNGDISFGEVTICEFITVKYKFIGGLRFFF